MKVKCSLWSRFRGYSSFETWDFPPPHKSGRSFTLAIALRPHVHSCLNQQLTVEVTYG